jgi:hypothetical protein
MSNGCGLLLAYRGRLLAAAYPAVGFVPYRHDYFYPQKAQVWFCPERDLGITL